MPDKKALIEEINALKSEKKAIVLAHTYQNIEVDEVADFVGDSLYLSRMAANTDAKIIVFAGVYFMAETAKILSPNKKVLLPRLESGCLMADMINLEQIVEFKQKYPNVPVVCYINSTAEVKSEVDICCTSSNAVQIVEKLNSSKVLFVPDANLGNYVQSQLENVEVITYPGYCPTHLRILKKDILKLKQEYPDAFVMVHPECHREVIQLADFVGSTTALMKKAKEIENINIIIATEKGVTDRLSRDIKDKNFILASSKAICPNMKWHYLEDILNALKFEQFEVDVSPNIRNKALKPIQRMLE